MEPINGLNEELKVAIVHDWLTGFAGGEQVTMALHQLFPGAPIYTSIYDLKKVVEFGDAEVRTSILQNMPFSRSKHQYYVPLMPVAFEALDMKGFEVVISVGALAKGVITHPGQIHINYCHTPIRYIWRFGGDSRAGGMLSGMKARVSHNLRIWDVISAQRVDQFIANSETVKLRIAKIYRRDSIVINPPVNCHAELVSASSTSSHSPYFLTVCRLVKYKRVDLMISACLNLKKKLVIIGDGPELKSLRKLAGNSPLIEFKGRLSDDERTKYYTNAKAFLFMAEEDFGITPIEAMSLGCPVIAYGKGGACETVQDGISGVFVKEQTTDSLVTTISEFERMSFDKEKIQKVAEKYSQEEFNKKILDLISRSLRGA